MIYAATQINTNNSPPLHHQRNSIRSEQKENRLPNVTDDQNIYTSAAEALNNPIYESDDIAKDYSTITENYDINKDTSRVNKHGIGNTGDHSKNPLYGDGEEDYATMSSNVGEPSYTKPIEENYYMTAVDNKDNPIYGTDDKSTEYDTVDNNLSRENKYYEGSLKHKQNKYASVKKNKKPVPASRNHAYDDVERPQKDFGEGYYQVGDIVRSGYPKQK